MFHDHTFIKYQHWQSSIYLSIIHNSCLYYIALCFHLRACIRNVFIKKNNYVHNYTLTNKVVGLYVGITLSYPLSLHISGKCNSSIMDELILM